MDDWSEVPFGFDTDIYEDVEMGALYSEIDEIFGAYDGEPDGCEAGLYMEQDNF